MVQVLEESANDTKNLQEHYKHLRKVRFHHEHKKIKKVYFKRLYRIIKIVLDKRIAGGSDIGAE
jgi:hypothetical protein